MTTTVRQWTGLEAKALRAALRMTMHEFADYLGVGTRTVAKWEARGTDIQPMPQTQAILDTALAKASSDVQARFSAVVSDLLTSSATPVDTVSQLGERSVEADAPMPLSVSVLQSRVLLPVLVDGRQVLLPLDTATVAGRALAFKPFILRKMLSPQILMTSRFGICSVTCTDLVVTRPLRKIAGRGESSALLHAWGQGPGITCAGSPGLRTSRRAWATPSKPARRSHG